MGTKRCVYCRKLSSIDAEVCQRCGHAFTATVPARPRTAKRSIPPASPHHAGHHSGLHPEDQPYQSSLMPVPPSPSSGTDQRRYARKEPEKIILPSIASTPAPPPNRRRLPPAPPPNQRRGPSSSAPRPLPPLRRPGRLVRQRNMRLALGIICLALLIIASSLAYVFISRQSRHVSAAPALTATPRQLRINDTFTLAGNGFGADDSVSFTRDNNITIVDGNNQPLHALTNDNGAFSIQIVVASSWTPGQHRIYAVDEVQLLSVLTTITIQQPSAASAQLKLSDKQIDLGTDVPGATTSEYITLSNTGGGQILWQASSDQPWLTVEPNSGIFSGSASVMLTANRGILSPQTYTGNVTFTRQDSNAEALTLVVTMTVKPAPASLSLLPATLGYSGSAAQSPPNQVITIQNNGGQALDWNSTISTGDGTNWLSMNPGSGHLDPGTNATLTVSVQTQKLAVGNYKGTINFTGGTNPQVTVNLNVVAPGNLVASPPSLNFTATTGTNPVNQAFTLQNSGGQPLDWAQVATTTDGAKWLTATPVSGHLEPSAKTSITAGVNIGSLKPGSYQGKLTFTYGGTTRQVSVSLTVSPAPKARIELSSSALTFNAAQGTDPASQTFTLTNTGNVPLNWSVAEDQNGTTYVPVTATSGSLPPGKSATLTVAPAVTQVGSGQTITATITVSDSDPGTTVQSAQMTVVVTIT